MNRIFFAKHTVCFAAITAMSFLIWQMFLSYIVSSKVTSNAFIRDFTSQVERMKKEVNDINALSLKLNKITDSKDSSQSLLVRKSAADSLKHAAALDVLTTLAKTNAIYIRPSANAEASDALSPGANGRFGDGFAKLFDLTEKEFDDIQATMEAAKAALDVIAYSNTKVSKSDDGLSITLEYEALPGADTIRDKVKASLEAVLGPSKMEAFLRLRQNGNTTPMGIDQFFYGFGLSGLRTTITRDESHGPKGYSISNKGLIPGTVVPSSTSSTSVENVRMKLGGRAQLLPDDF